MTRCFLLRAVWRLLLACTLISAHAASAQPPVSPLGAEGLRAERMLPGERIVLDGSLSHPAWQRAVPYSRFVEHAPRQGTSPPQRTQVQVLFDESALYVGVMAFDDQPQAIRDVVVRYDGVNRTQDFVVAYVDPIGNKASAQFFRVNAAGSIADGLHTAVDDSEDFSPDFDWDAAVQRRADGWSAVMRIPFASLRFAENEPGQAQSPWRFMLARRLPREQFHWILSVELPRGSPSFIDQLQTLQGVALPERHNFITVRPSLTLRQTEQRSNGNPSQRENHTEASLDVKWRPRAELVIDATIKPDFSQVALDVPQLAGNSRFALYLPEKRPFFFESADLLRTPTDALYTRSITQPRGGLRATWRSPTWQGTALAAADLGGGSVLLPGPYGTDAVDQPGSRVLAARVRRDGGHGGVAIGALLASRQYEDGRGNNQVLGADMDASLGDDWRMRMQLLGSQTSALAQGGQLRSGAAQDGHRLYATVKRQTSADEFSATLEDISPHFRHDTGFVNQVGIRSLGLHQAWKWQHVGPFNNFDLFADAREVQDSQTGRSIERSVYLGFWSAAARNLEWWLEVHPQTLSRKRADAPLLTQRMLATGLVMTPAPWWPFLDANLNIGRLIDSVAIRERPGARLNLSSRLRPLRDLEFEPSLSQAWLYDDAGGQRRLMYHESAAQALVIWHLDARHNLRLILQRTGLNRVAESGVSAQRFVGQTQSLTYQWRRSAGTQLFVGFSRERDASPSQPRNSEAFIKLQLDADELRAWW